MRKENQGSSAQEELIDGRVSLEPFWFPGLYSIGLMVFSSPSEPCLWPGRGRKVFSSGIFNVFFFFFFLSMELRWEPLETEGPILLEGQLHTMQWASQAHRPDKQFKSSAVEGNRVVWGLGGG